MSAHARNLFNLSFPRCAPDVRTDDLKQRGDLGVDVRGQGNAGRLGNGSQCKLFSFAALARVSLMTALLSRFTRATRSWLTLHSFAISRPDSFDHSGSASAVNTALRLSACVRRKPCVSFAYSENVIASRWVPSRTSASISGGQRVRERPGGESHRRANGIRRHRRRDRREVDAISERFDVFGYGRLVDGDAALRFAVRSDVGYFNGGHRNLIAPH